MGPLIMVRKITASTSFFTHSDPDAHIYRGTKQGYGMELESHLVVAQLYYLRLAVAPVKGRMKLLLLG